MGTYSGPTRSPSWSSETLPSGFVKLEKKLFTLFNFREIKNDIFIGELGKRLFTVVIFREIKNDTFIGLEESLEELIIIHYLYFQGDIE